jgi:hypothetical protein
MLDDDNNVINWADDSSDNESGAFSSGEMIIVDELPEGLTNSEHINIVQFDHQSGEEITQTVDFASPALTVDQAKEITERIKTTTNVLYLLIKRAHAGKAYTALGYSNFEEYVRSEFNFSRSYAYKLLNQATVIEAIEEVAPEGTSIYIGDATARGLKKILPEILAEVEEKTNNLSGNDAGAVIEDIIRDHRDKEKARLDAIEDEDDFDDDEPRKHDGPYTGDYEGGFDDDDDEDDDGSVSSYLDEDPAAQRRKFDKLYNLYAGLKGIDSIGDAEELPAFVPEERRVEFDTLIETVTPWLIEFRELWRSYNADKDSLDEDPETGLDFNE